MPRAMMTNSRMMFDIKVRQEKDVKTGELYLYDDIESDYIDFWSGETIESSTSGKAIQKKLEEMGDISELNVYIASNGGSVKEGLAIYSQISRMQCRKTAYIDGIAASIATVIACACDKIVMNPTSLFFIHNAWSRAVGNAKQLREAADDLDIITGASKQAYLAKSGGKLSEEKLTEMMDKEKWLTPAECVEYGICDEITERQTESGDAPKQYKQALTMGAEMSRLTESRNALEKTVAELSEKVNKLREMLTSQNDDAKEKWDDKPMQQEASVTDTAKKVNKLTEMLTSQNDDVKEKWDDKPMQQENAPEETAEKAEDGKAKTRRAAAMAMAAIMRNI